MTAYGKTRDSLKSHSLTPKKKLGQNFLVHKQTAESIAHAGRLKSVDTVIEVGVGLGALTTPIAEKVNKVIGLEIDSGLVRFHNEENDLPENVTVLHLDVLKADFSELYKMCDCKKLIIMANLPYSISNPFIFKMIENIEYVSSGTIMLQKEVADRLSAPPNTKDYGIPTVLLGRCATVKKLMTLKPAEFHPRPKIDSVVVRIDFEEGKDLFAHDYNVELFTKIVRSAFSQRRKTILNTISNGPMFQGKVDMEKAEKKQITEKIILQADLSPKARAETLSIEDFIRLTKSFETILN